MPVLPGRCFGWEQPGEGDDSDDRECPEPGPGDDEDDRGGDSSRYPGINWSLTRNLLQHTRASYFLPG